MRRYGSGMDERGRVVRLRPKAISEAIPQQAQGERETTGVGEKFVEALVNKDRDALLSMLSPKVKMRGMAPGRSWESHDATTLVDDILLGDFFGPGTDIEELSWARFGTIVDKSSASYYLRMRQGDQRIDCEQHAFFDVDGGVIYGLHLACSGFTPVPRAAGE